MKIGRLVLFCVFFLMFGQYDLNLRESQVPRLKKTAAQERLTQEIIRWNKEQIRQKALLSGWSVDSFPALYYRWLSSWTADIMHEVVPECQTLYPCIIRKNNGGTISYFEGVAQLMALDVHSRLMIDGDCASACVILADEARPRVCITERAVFWFHKGYNRTVKPDDPNYRFDPIQSPDITAWVMEHGGFPADDEHMLDMHADEAQWFWPMCIRDPSAPLPRSDRLKMTATAK